VRATDDGETKGSLHHGLGRGHLGGAGHAEWLVGGRGEVKREVEMRIGRRTGFDDDRMESVEKGRTMCVEERTLSRVAS
jgi:hypothetical protein